MPAPLFADYAPRLPTDPRPSLPPDLTITPATLADAPAIARLTAERNGTPLAQTLPSVERHLHDDLALGNLILTAKTADTLVGFARARHVRPTPPDDHPEGWYLLGVIVAPPLRRRGIATALTLHRLARIARRADSAYYFANSLNLPSIDLHHRLGFTEIRRPFTFPNTHFSAGGTGILFRLHPLAHP